MAKYNEKLYDTFYYDEASTSSAGDAAGEVVWILNIKWNGVDFVNEAGNWKGFDSFQGAEHYVDANGNGFEAMRPGLATLTLIDPDRRYDPNNASSPLYPYILPGREVQISVYVVATDELIDVMAGTITDIQPVSGKEQVTITVEDGLRQLADTKVSCAMMSMPGIAEAIGSVLTKAGWNGQKFLQTTAQPVQVFNPETGQALDIIQTLAAANLGTFFMDRKNRATFYPVSYTSPTTTVITEDQIYKEIRLSKPWETVRNEIEVKANQRGRQPGSVIWSLIGAVTFAAGETKTFGAVFDLADGIAQPRPWQDYAANTASDGSGTDVSESFTISFSEVGSSECLMSVKNTTGAEATLLSLRLVGHKVVSSPVRFRPVPDAASVAAYRLRSFLLDNPWLQDRNYASTYSTWLQTFLKDPQMNAIIQIEQRPALQFKLWLMDHVNLQSASRNIDITRHVRGIRHEWLTENGQSCLTTVYLQYVYYNATSITADPFIPGQPDIPTVPFPDTPPLDPYVPYDPYIPPYIPLDPTNACLLTDAIPNGAYTVTPTNLRLANEDGGNREAFVWYPCTLRAGNALNKSTLIIWGGWSYTNDSGVQTYDIFNNWWHVDAIAADKTVLASGVISNISNYQRNVVFSPTTAIEVAGFRIWVDETGDFGLGDQISTGAIDVTDEDGTAISGLVVGRYYAVEATGGPWYFSSNHALWSYAFWLKPNVTWSRGGGNTYLGYENNVSDGDVLYCHRIGSGNYSRAYFKAAATSVAMRAARIPGEDWTQDEGSLSYILSNASGTGNKLMTINNAGLKNVCSSGIL